VRLFRILFVFDVLGLLVLAYFFVDGLRYASSGGDYFGIWMPIVLVPILVLGGSWALNANGKTTAANVLLGALAAPFVIALLFVGLFVVLQPDMR